MDRSLGSVSGFSQDAILPKVSRTPYSVVASLKCLLCSYIPAVALASPILTYCLLKFVSLSRFSYFEAKRGVLQASGVPPLERKADKLYKDDPKWKDYKS